MISSAAGSAEHDLSFSWTTGSQQEGANVMPGKVRTIDKAMFLR